MRDLVETAFLDWKIELDEQVRDFVMYDTFDSSLKTVYVLRGEDFDPFLLRSLEKALQQTVHQNLLVSSIVERIPD